MTEEQAYQELEPLIDKYGAVTVLRWARAGEKSHLKRKAKYDAPQADLTNEPEKTSNDTANEFDPPQIKGSQEIRAFLRSISDEQLKKLKASALANAGRIKLTSRRKS